MPDVQSPVPPDLWAGLAGPFISAVAGMAARHARYFRADKPLQWRKIAADLPLLVLAPFFGAGGAEIMGWGDKVYAGCAIAGVFVYFGHKGLDTIWLWLQAKVPANGEQP